jgi:small-conductance mechanosensitive channel
MVVLLVCAILGSLGLARPAAAQSPLASLAAPAPAAVAAATKPPAAPALTPAETRQMIDLLNDPQKRAAFTATLETLSKATAVVNPPKPAAVPVPLAPDSVGAQVLRESTNWISGLSAQVATFGRVLGDLPSVWAFSLRTVQNPALRARALDAAWRLALVLALAGVAEWGLWALLRRPVRGIARSAPGGTPAEPVRAPRNASEARVEAAVEAADGDADLDSAAHADDAPPEETGIGVTEGEEAVVEHVLRRRRFARTIRTLKLLPFVLMWLVLELLPMGAFLGVGYAGTLFATPNQRAVLQAAFLAYIVCRAAVAIMRTFVQPRLPSLRLVHVSDEGAEYAVVWVRRVFAIGAVGYAASQIGAMFGLPQAANEAFLKAVFLVVHLCGIVIVLQCRRSVAARIRSPRANPGVGGRIRNRLAAIWHLVAIFYIAGLWMVWAAEVRNGYLRIWHIFLLTVGVMIAARLVSIVVLGGLDRAFRIPAETNARFPGLEKRADRYYPLLRRTVSGILVVITFLALLQAWGINTFSWFNTNALGGRLVSASLTVLVAAAVAVAVWEGVNASMDHHLATLTKQAQYAKSARLRTLLPILRTVLLATLVGVFGLTVLSEIGVNIAPLLAGAGILGVAIGFGSQKLVQDFITGIFLLLENAMQVGDWVTVAGLSGSVENLSIRTMRLRAGDGSVHIIPFSSVSTVTNVNRGIGNAAITVSVPLAEDSDHVSEVLSDIARDMRGEPRFAEMMRSDLQLWGVDKVDSGIVTIVGQIVCTDSGRWGVQREFNRRMALRFKELGIRIATPVQTIYAHTVAEQDKPALTQDTNDRPTGQVTESPPPAALGNTS